MGKWEMVRLGDVCEVINGYAFESTQFNSGGKGCPIIRIRDVVRGYTETFTTEPFDEKYLVHTGDLLIGMDGEFNISKWKSADALLNQRVCRLSENPNIVNNSYILYSLPNKLKEIESATPFVTVKHLSSKKIESIFFPLPPLPVQQKIADVLDRAGTLIEKRKAQIQKLDLLVKAQFIEMFGDPVTNPMGWEVRKIKEFATVKIGPFGSLLHAEDYIENGIPLVNPSHIIDGKIVADSKLTLSCKKYKSMSAYALKAGDIVLGRRGEIGRCAVVGSSEYLCGTGSMFIRIERDYLPIVLQRIISSTGMRRVLEDNAVGITMLNLNAGTVANLEVLCPPIPLQNVFAAFVERIEAQKAQLKKSLALLELNYKSLMQKCFNGEMF